MEAYDGSNETVGKDGDDDDEATDSNEEDVEPDIQHPAPRQHQQHRSTKTLFENENISQIAVAYSWKEFQRFVNARTGCLPQQKGMLFTCKIFLIFIMLLAPSTVSTPLSQ